jgi:hypothetical protein
MTLHPTDVPAPPQYRATLSHSQLMLLDWEPWFMRDYGPCNRLLGAAHVGPIADLTVTRDDADRRELIVSELGRRAVPEMRAALVAWATLLGYERIWFRDDVVDLDPSRSGAGQRVSTTCRVCASTWVEDTPEFWLSAQHNGAFPSRCPSCGHALPQWAPVPAPECEPADRDADADPDRDAEPDSDPGALATEAGAR